MFIGKQKHKNAVEQHIQIFYLTVTEQLIEYYNITTAEQPVSLFCRTTHVTSHLSDYVSSPTGLVRLAARK